MNFVGAWEQNGTLGMSQRSSSAIYQRFHPNLRHGVRNNGRTSDITDKFSTTSNRKTISFA